jgi:hypothetical protein
LNDVYDSEYDSFGAVPRGPGNFEKHPRTYDWVRFHNQRFADWHEWLAGIVEEEAPEVPIHTKLMGHPAINRPTYVLNQGIDPELYAAFTDINGNDNHSFPESGADGNRDYVKFYDYQRSFADAPVFNSENHLVPNEDDHYGPTMGKHVRLNLWQGALHGMNASTMWVWERTYDESKETFAGSILNRPDCVAAVGKTNLDTNRLGEELLAFQRAAPDVAIVHSVAARLYGDAHLEHLDTAYEALTAAGRKIAFASEETIQNGALADHETVVLPTVGRLHAPTIERLASFVEAGGTVVAIGGAPDLDPWGAPLPSDARTTVANAARTVPPDVAVVDLRSVLTDTTDTGPVSVTAPDGTILPDVEWRAVERDGQYLVNVANLADSAVELRIVRNGEQVTPERELLGETDVDGGQFELAGLTPALFTVSTE